MFAGIKNKIFRGFKSGRDKFGRENFSPERDWKIIIVIFVCSGILIGFISLYLFLNIKKGNFFTVSTDNSFSVTTLERKIFNETMGSFEIKRQELEKIKANKSVSPDPSL